MNGTELLKCLEFGRDLLFTEQVNALSTLQLYILVDNRNWFLPFKAQPIQMKFFAETIFVC